MSDGLVVSGGGVIAVASDELFAAASAMEVATRSAVQLARELAAVDRIVGAGRLRLVDAPASAFEAEREIDSAIVILGDLEALCLRTSGGLRLSADVYGFAEQSVERLAQAVLAKLGWGVGLVLPVLISVALPGTLAAAAVLLTASALAPEAARDAATGARHWMQRNNHLLTNPVTVAMVGALVTTADDVRAGALRIPLPLQQLLGDEGLGITGMGSTAALLLAAGPFGIFAESPVAVKATGTSSVDRVPHGLAERLDRIPDAATNPEGEQIRVDHYREAGKPARFEVYIGGTADFSPVTGDEPFDMTSNIAAMSSTPPASLRAIELALADAGVTPQSPITMIGHSQGATLAQALAASGNYNTTAVLAVGGPFGAVDVPAGIPVIEIEHTDDIVTAMGGPRADRDAVVVSRRAFAPGEVPTETFFPAHDLGEYRNTAVLAEQASDERLRAALAAFDTFGRGDVTVTSTSYLARRVEQ